VIIALITSVKKDFDAERPKVQPEHHVYYTWICTYVMEYQRTNFVDAHEVGMHSPLLADCLLLIIAALRESCMHSECQPHAIYTSNDREMGRCTQGYVSNDIGFVGAK